MKLIQIKNTEARREHGSIDDLKASIAEVGLINPLTVDTDGNLLAGRRRYQALKELDWEDVPVRVLPVEGDALLAFRIAIDENLRRKPLTDPEVAAAIKEYDELKRQMEGSKTQGQRTDTFSQSEKVGWGIEDTARDLNISVGAAHKSIQIATAVEDNPELAGLKSGQAILDAYESKQEKDAHVKYASGEYEWYTPIEYIQAARAVMGGIDCDPASSDKANEVVGAGRYFTIKDDGRQQAWGERVWMNPPYSQPLVSDFCMGLVEKYRCGEVKQACVLINNATETSFFQILLGVASAVCFVKGRIRFTDPQGKPGAPLQGQVVLYLGARIDTFASAFSQFGGILYGKRC